MAFGPEDIHYKVSGELVSAYDIDDCKSWEELADLLGDKLATKIKKAGYMLACERTKMSDRPMVSCWFDDHGCKQHFVHD